MRYQSMPPLLLAVRRRPLYRKFVDIYVHRSIPKVHHNINLCLLNYL